MSSDSTWGIPKPVRTVLAARITELRVGLQEDARRQLAAWGITAREVGPPPGGRTLSADDTAARDLVLAVLETRRQAGLPQDEALDAYLEEVAFTLLNRLVTFRCLEERGLLRVGGQPETLVARDAVRGASSLVWRTRDANKELDERSVARAAYRTACLAMTERVKVLFDPDDEASAVFPTLPLWQQAIAALNDPAIPPAVFAEDEIMGWVYQYWSTELKNEVYAKLAKGGKIDDPSELAAATALYTERYIVDYLVQNTLGATWVEMKPDTTLPATWPYYVTPPTGNPPGERERKRVRDLTLIDPCVGSGHFLVRAFDVFVQLYKDEGEEAPEDVASLILERNLYGADIDRRAVQIAALALYVKGCALAGADFRPKKLNLVACDIAIPPDPPAEFLDSLDEPQLKDLATSLWTGLAGIRTFGSLLHPERAVNDAFARLKARGKGSLWETDTDWAKKRAHFMAGLRKAFTAAAGDTDLTTRLFGEEASRGLDALQILGRRYDVVVTNPPYAGSGNLDPGLRKLLASLYETGKSDLYAAFILRCSELANSGGRFGVLTQEGWMFLESLSDLRATILRNVRLQSLAHFGSRAFEEIGGAIVSTAAFAAICLPGSGARFSAIRLVDLASPAEKSAILRRVISGVDPEHRLATPRQDAFGHIPDQKIAYWLGARFLQLLGTNRRMNSEISGGKGLGTSDNDRFLRCFWEVRQAPSKWFPYTKGGGFRRWVGNEWLVVNYADRGDEIRNYIASRYPYLKGNVGILVRQVEFYGKPGMTHTNVAQGSAGFRLLPRRGIFSDKGPGFFPTSGDRRELPGLLAHLNIRYHSYLLRALSPGIEFQLGQVLSLPSMPSSTDTRAILESIGIVAIDLKVRLTESSPAEARFLRTAAGSGTALEALLATIEGYLDDLGATVLGLSAEDVDEALAVLGVPAGWNTLIAGYDRLPAIPDGIEIPAGLADFLAAREHHELAPAELAKVKARLRALYEAGPGAKEEIEAPAAKDGDEEEGAAVGARNPIPTETFLEDLAIKTGLHPITVHWLLEELKAKGAVSPPLRKAELEEYLDITLVRMLGYRWPEQDAYEAEHGLILDPDLVDGDGIIPLVPCGDEPVAEERVRTRLARQFGDDGADAFLADLRRYTKRDLADWIRKDFFKAHAKRFKNRPIAWHLKSPEGAFEALVLYHRLGKDTLAKLRVTYAGDRLARLRADQQRAKDAYDSRTVTDLQLAIEDVDAFRQTLAAIEQGTELRHRIRCRWKDETETGRPGPYAIDIDDGVKVNIRPFHESGLLPAKVISKW